MNKSIAFWGAVLLLLLYGGYSLFFGSSPVSDVTSSFQNEGDEEPSFVASIISTVSSPDILPDSMWKDNLVGTWTMHYVEQNSEYIDQIDGQVTYKPDGTFSRIATYTHYGYNKYQHERPYGRSPYQGDDYIITRSGLKNAGRWIVKDKLWVESITTCSSKRAINSKFPRLRYYDSNPCSFFPKGGKVTFGSKDVDYDKYTLKKFQENSIQIEHQNFETGGKGTYYFIRLE